MHRIKIEPGIWPCPRAHEGVPGCKKRLWSDAAIRRTFQPQRREQHQSNDTFACRFYDRLANNSPCERPLLLAFGEWEVSDEVRPVPASSAGNGGPRDTMAESSPDKVRRKELEAAQG
jgi:hypothetical protein